MRVLDQDQQDPKMLARIARGKAGTFQVETETDQSRCIGGHLMREGERASYAWREDRTALACQRHTGALKAALASKPKE